MILGLIQEQMTEAQRQAMESHTPPELREFWTGPGVGLYDSFIADLRRWADHLDVRHTSPRAVAPGSRE